MDGLTAEHVSELLRDDAGKPLKRTKADVTAYVEFEAGDTQVVNAAVAISAVSADGAKANHDAEAHQSFDEARTAAIKKWQRALNFDVKGGTSEQKEIFYTALYHTKIAPQVHQDVTRVNLEGWGKVLFVMVTVITRLPMVKQRQNNLTFRSIHCGIPSALYTH